MSKKRMLIDASHPEETRVAVLSGDRLEDFDVESASRKQLKGNIYLAKVTRVEPSLQAAFVDYGGNRHGFLAFGEIHPDYYQIPIADREALVAEQSKLEAQDRSEEAPRPADAAKPEEPEVEVLGGDDAEEVEIRRPHVSPRHYKIQEVIKRRQILLVQVVKEERGTKGAALTTYISLAGRYCVLMPNTARGGGISRKIASGTDRKRLKSILAELGIPEGMAVIVRTAGADRGKAEIKRDCEYLLRLWDQIRETTLQSTAPTLVHEEGNLIKRSIRDLHGNDIEEIVVDGDEGYRVAKEFMKLLIPSHAKRVQRYKDAEVSMAQRFKFEEQLEAMHSPRVQLRSGGYIVINPTEALVSIDVNSGRATRERNIEETALKTNLEAADEIARQLRLRDLSGLIVIDFIDMEVSRNQGLVERRLKEAMRVDRARIQIGRISVFGLLELSRQRLRPSLIETSSEPCPHCGGTGIRRSTGSAALSVLRAIEDEAVRRRAAAITVHLPTAVALYVLNHKRAALGDIETHYEIEVLLSADDSLIPPDCRIERTRTKEAPAVADAAARAEDERDKDEVAADAAGERAPADEEEAGRRRRRRRSRRRKRGDEDRVVTGAAEAGIEAAGEAPPPEDEAAPEPESGGETRPGGDEGDEEARRRRRRGRRGGRRRGRRGQEPSGEESTDRQQRESGTGPAPFTAFAPGGAPTPADPWFHPSEDEDAEEPDEAEPAAAVVPENEPPAPEPPAEAEAPPPEPAPSAPPHPPRRGWWQRIIE